MGWETTYRTAGGALHRVAHWRDERGKHASKTLGPVSPAEVCAYIEAREAEVAEALATPGVDLARALDDFAEWAGEQCQPATVRLYLTYLRRLFAVWGDLPPARWTPEALQDAMRAMGIQPGSRIFVVRAGRAFLRWPGSAALGAPDFVKGVRAPKRRTRIPSTLSRPDRIRLVDAARGTPLAVPVALAAGMGLRPKEWRRARHDDVWWDRGTMRVRRKGDYQQVLPIPPTVMDVLRAHGRSPALSGPVVRLTLRGALGGLHALCERIDVARMSWYGLRHTALTLMAEREPLHVVQRYAGHASIKTTEVYLHAQEHHLRAAADRDL